MALVGLDEKHPRDRSRERREVLTPSALGPAEGPSEVPRGRGPRAACPLRYSLILTGHWRNIDKFSKQDSVCMCLIKKFLYLLGSGKKQRPTK